MGNARSECKQASHAHQGDVTKELSQLSQSFRTWYGNVLTRSERNQACRVVLMTQKYSNVTRRGRTYFAVNLLLNIESNQSAHYKSESKQPDRQIQLIQYPRDSQGRKTAEWGG